MKALLIAVPLGLAAPVAAQMHDMGGMKMPGMVMAAKPVPARKPAMKKPVPRKAARAGTAAKAEAVDHAAMGHAMPNEPPAAQAMPDMPGMVMPAPSSCPPEHAAMGHCQPSTPAAPATATAAATGTDQPAGDAPPPPAPATRAAAAFYDPAAMARSDAAMRREHGGMRFSQILFNLAEVQVREGRDGYRWDGAGWFGGDIDRVVVKSEGEGGFGDRLDTAEVQALYSRAIDPYWNMQAGIRQDLGRGAKRTFATVGIEGLAPYWFDVEGAAFLSDKGVRARAEAWVDQRITQRAILQPRVELNLAAQDEPDARIGAGLSNAEIGLRLRYEFAREFAPYVGVTWERRYGATARYARADGGDTGGFALALGLRTWF